MKSKIKKTLIIISSAIVLFLGVFFMTRSLNNLIEGSENEKVISVEDNSSKTVTEKSDTLNNSAAEIENNNNKNNIVIDKEDSNKAQATNTQTTNNLPTDKYTDYIVKEGDTLFSIARNAIPWKSQDEAVKILETMNNLKNREVISVGARLMVPVNTIDATGCTKYIVKSGESLYTIAENFFPDMNIAKAVDTIMKKNNINDPNLLSVGLEIYIPNDELTSVNSNSVENTETSEVDEDVDSENITED